ncbi:hypothetical protein ES703_61519 [subsurface metagenome]
MPEQTVGLVGGITRQHEHGFALSFVARCVGDI